MKRILLNSFKHNIPKFFTFFFLLSLNLVRQKLPDNLKSQFRPFAMLTLDVKYIFEMMFYIDGFSESKQLARKLIQLHTLCSDQLTVVEHYDFNIRTMKTIVRLAKMLKRNNTNMSENGILLKSILNVNRPKLIIDDLTLFNDICVQVFGDCDAIEDDISPSIEPAIIKQCLENRHINVTKFLIEKINEIYKMLMIKNGIIMIGETMTGKTTAWQALSEIIKEIKSNENANINDVIYRIINPKSISMGQLYGQIDCITQEWCEGVLAKVFLEMVAATTTQQSRGWIIFDGIIDPIWTECLHTLLDDNSKLCLASGEMIEKTCFMTILFETNDLEYASPSTIARCGIIYFNESNDHWKNFHLSFVRKLHGIGLIDIYMNLFETLVEWLIPAVLDILKNCKSILEVLPTQQYKVIIFLFLSIESKVFHSKMTLHFVCLQIFSQFFQSFVDNQSQFNQIWFQQTFIFSLAWAYASTLLS